MKKYIALFIVSIIAISCSSSDDLDTTKPVVTIEEPIGHQEIEPGTSINFKALVSDDSQLASYKIEIHGSEDGHQHRSEHVDFTYEFVGSLSGTSEVIQKSIEVPSNVEHGHYHVGLFVIDASGNQNQQFVEVYIGEENHQH